MDVKKTCYFADMLSGFYVKLRIYTWLLFIILYCLPLLAKEVKPQLSPEKINLALRRTADQLLRAAGDSTSRIPAIEQYGSQVWRVNIEQSFRYEQLPFILQESFDLYEIKHTYQVAIKRCEDATIDLGYHQQDFIINKQIPCGGRELTESCRYIEITFLEPSPPLSVWFATSGVLLLIFAGIGGYRLLKRHKAIAVDPNSDAELIEIGNSRLNVQAQILIHGEQRQQLTYRETKLLHLFANNPNQLLERDFILNKVWEDEGVQVGRSIDVFVSRLRKKLSFDSTVGIVAIHGVGYKLETGK